MAKDTYLQRVLGSLSALKNTKVLMVGAGGIGCELLKDLILMGYGEIHILDMDTISLSNLNRQFLFRHRDIDQSKALTVVHAVAPFNFHGTKLVAHHGSVMDSALFPLRWFSQFSVVFNALDNIEARAHVNRVCLFLKTPMMESGTTGFNGQVQPVLPYRTECFDCTAKETPKTFPVCTIRSTPSQPVHCVVWAKDFLFALLFADEAPQPSEAELAAQSANASEVATLLRETNELADLKTHVGEPSFARAVVTKLFQVDVERLLLIDALWTARARPVPLVFDDHLDPTVSSSIAQEETTLWSVAENLRVLVDSIHSLQRRVPTLPFIAFDKDDEDTLNFVTAAANLRLHVFLIPLLTKFDLKQIAGNIIPAIATTNAVIAGFLALQSLSIVGQQPDAAAAAARMVFTSKAANKFVITSTLAPGSAKCPSCRVARGVLMLGEAGVALTLAAFVEAVKATYGYDDLAVVVGKNRLIYDADFEDSLLLSLGALGFVKGEVIQITDDADELETVELYVEVEATTAGLALPSLVLKQKPQVPQSLEPVPESKPDEAMPLVVDANGAILVEDDDDDLVVAGKRRHSGEAAVETPLKKSRHTEADEHLVPEELEVL